MATRPRRSSDMGERLAALEAVWETLPDKIAAAMAGAAERLTPLPAYLALVSRVEVLEGKAAFHAGAVKVENRVRSEAQEWARTLTPMFWAACASVVGALWIMRG